MRGVICNGESIRLQRDLSEPSTRPGEAVLRVRMIGICDTDLQLARGYMGFRGILGHEFVGLDASGRRVSAEINNSCQDCPTCHAGCPQHCPNRSVLGIVNHDGAMADLVCVPDRNLHAVPDSIDDLEAVFIEPLAAAFRVPEQVPIGPGVALTVLGDGKLGILCAWVARLLGARVTLVGKHPEKLAIAGQDVRSVLLEEVKSLARSQDVVIDATGSTSGFSTAIGIVRPCGTIVLKTTVAGEHALSLAPIVIDEIQVVGSRCGPFPKAIEALGSRAIDVRPLIGEVYPLDRAEEAFEAAGRPGARKILISV
ncbi:MDR/zinc-dependent alcohol dehydrogenase-like family protein [Tundrisphaera lichenicola]|uniref:MDR/zinc-dependent alcohol dehydrogenase-like family protein n=1 Tax=Tundrisphaera lichenicola TaxID=2029860 RepID=UPI003EBD3437